MKTFENDSCIRYVNLTGSTVYLRRYRREALRIEPTGYAEVERILHREDNVDGVQFYTQSYGQVRGLPDEQGDVVLIVNERVRLACKDRYDLASTAGFADGIVDEDIIGLVMNTDPKNYE